MDRIRSEHEAFVSLYGILERGFVPHCPTNLDTHCPVTGRDLAVMGGRSWAEETPEDRTLSVRMGRRLVAVIGQCNLPDWSDSHSKAEVLAAVETCIRQTAPEPHVELEIPTEVVA